MFLGSRVVRNPDWIWGDQDGGEGHVGTIISITSEYQEGIPLDRVKVTVHWDNGIAAEYTTSIDGNHDLRILDSSPSGVKFDNHKCDACGTEPILGLCWHCKDCSNYDLCTTCYMEDKHDLDHKFLCKLYMNHKGKQVDKRSLSQKYQAKGIYPGASVVPMDDDVQLGIGLVIDLNESNEESNLGKCAVCWQGPAEDVSIHKLGLDGQVELKFIESSDGPMYYRDHLPIVEFDKDQLYVGDHVCINRLNSVKAISDLDVTKVKELTGEIGKVSKVEPANGAVSVEYEDLEGAVWRYSDPTILSKTPNVSKEDAVRLTDNIEALEKLQSEKYQLGFQPNMREVLNKVGKVKEIENGTVKVEFPFKRTLWLNPAALKLEGEVAMVGQVVKESVDIGLEKVTDVALKTATNAVKQCKGIKNALKNISEKKVLVMLTDKPFTVDMLDDERGRDASMIRKTQHPGCLEEDLYSMTSSSRGLMVIINIQNFAVDPKREDREQLIRELTERTGSEKDVNDLEELFTRDLNFKVCTIIDKPRLDLLRELREIVDNTAGYEGYDCFALCIMSHGKGDMFYAYDGDTIKVQAVCSMFSNSNCEAFCRKPKLFFIQACRGQMGMGYDVADAPFGNVQRSTLPFSESKDLDMADMLIAYSSFEDYTSYRHTIKGSYFIQSLVSVFKQYADKEDVLHMMTRVNNEVYDHIHGTLSGRTQVPAPTSTLRKKLFLARE